MYQGVNGIGFAFSYVLNTDNAEILSYLDQIITHLANIDTDIDIVIQLLQSCVNYLNKILVNTDNIWDLVEKKVAWHDALPVLAMPTIASTGSEMDKSCVIANVEKVVKSGINGDILRPRASFLDPTNTFSVSPKQTACGGFDIMAHLFDMNYFVNSDKYPLQFNVVETLLRTVRQQLPIAVEEPENYSARATMLWAASWALNSFCTSGYKTQAQLHALEQFSSTYDMTHGLALAIITPKWMTYLLNKDETVARDFARFGLNVMGIQDQGDDMANAKAGIEALQNFIKDELHLPTTLSEMNITDEKFDELKGIIGTSKAAPK